MKALISLTAALLLLSGCSRPFPERLNWYGHHPYLYSMAFTAAAEEALVRSMTGRGYYEHMGDAAYTLAAGGTCDRAGLERYLVHKAQGCHLLSGPPAPDCINADSCASFQYDRELFADPAIRQVVEEALRRPCDFLTHPDLVAHRNATARFGMTADANWRIFLCEGPGVFGESIVFDDATEALRVHFRRGP
ncbi:hypothetical protein [Brevundimonas denitrificans]|uniref:hypothetical protein n=1 Tax=Brevundimonas denitrificans TaxID=1443434 RepID=UPI00223A6F5E|nr:hypothetical protein [Brevundimonas denitrificans]